MNGKITNAKNALALPADRNCVLLRTRPLNLLDELFVKSIEDRFDAYGFKDFSALSIKDFNDLTSEEKTKLKALDIEVYLPKSTVEVEPEFTTTLADDMLFRSRRHARVADPKMIDRCSSLLRGAQRFVLTEEAAIKVGEAIHSYPEMLVEQGIFARTPFDTCWIEMPSRKFHETIVPGSSSPTADHRVGYLFHNETVYVAAQISDTGDWSPMCYHLHRPLSLKQELELSEKLNVSRMQLDAFYWGGTMMQNLPHHIMRQMRNQHGVSVHAHPTLNNKFDGDQWLKMCAGEVRNIIGLLLMMNQPSSIVRSTAVGHRRKMTSKGTRVLMAHSVITINLDKRSKPSRLLRRPEGTHASPKWHQVINHWCNDKISRKTGYSIDDPKTYQGRELLDLHAHDWEMVDEETLRFRCKVCGGRRWRRKYPNGRGDKSRGIVSQDRIIKTDANTEVTDRFFT